jgi:CubicO group peptidase (beta-lactamase class C family)
VRAAIRLFAALLLLTSVTAIAQTKPDCDAPGKLDDGWTVSRPGEQGLDPSLICSIGSQLDAWKEANVHAVVVVRHGTLVYEAYFTGEDENWGRKLGRVTYKADMVHDLRSVTKSLTSLVIGIAVDRGWIKDLDAPVLSFFPEYADLRTPEKDRITLRHLLMMSTGLVWDEDTPYSDPDNDETQMYKAPDPYRYVLERPVGRPPGRVFNYVTGAPTLLGAVVHKVTGRQYDAVAREVLFDPLGISQVEWTYFDNGDLMAGGGLRLRPRDLAKIGQLVLAHGVWNGQQIVPAAWIEQSTAPRLNAYSMYFYGYQWWLGRSLLDGRQVDWIAGRGYGGQRLIIVPSEDVVMVVMAGHYDSSPLQEIAAVNLLNRNVLPAILN